MIAPLTQNVKALYDPIRLQAHSLAAMLAPSQTTTETAAEFVGKLLLDAIESLRPADSVPPSRREWLSYRLLWLRYAQAQPAVTIQRGAVCLRNAPALQPVFQ